MQYLYDHAGRRYLDAYNNVPHVGHSHPRVVQAATEQMLVLNTNTRYLHDKLAMFAERLAATLPSPLRVCYFVNSGSEANELALRLARAHTRRRDVIVLDAAYHGNTTTLVDISPYKFNGPGGEGAPPWVHVAAAARHLPRQVPARRSARRGEVRRVRAPRRATRRRSSPRARRASAGRSSCPIGYLAAVYAIVRGAGGVCIADEVQTAYGRMGTHFYAFEAQRVVPDIVVLGKPIGNGYPLGAVVTTPEIAASFDNGMEFFSTFGGSTVACAVGLAVLDVVEEERLQEHARDVGAALLDRLRAAGRPPPAGRRRARLGPVPRRRAREGSRDAGARHRRSVRRRQPHARARHPARHRRPVRNVLKIRPPMPFTREDAEHLARRTLDEGR